MVNHNNIFKKIGYILNELQDQYQFLSDNPNQLSELELELFLANAKFLADHVQIVKRLTIDQPLKELPEAASKDEDEIVGSYTFKESITPPPFKPEMPAEVPTKDAPAYVDSPPTFEFVLNDRSPEEAIDLEEVIEDNHHEEQVDYDNQEAEDIEEYDNEVTYVQPVVEELGPEPFLVYNEVKNEEPLIPEKPEAVKEAPKVEPIKHPEPVTQYQQSAPVLVEDDLKAQEIPKPTHTFVPDKVEDKIVQPSATAPRPTLNELLAANQKPNNSNNEATAPTITDLKKSVNLNEKLLYIKDLFNGYNLAYSEAIDIINKLPDFKSADAFLQHNYAVKNNWQSRQSTVDKFYELLKQRFPEA
ncbi:MAG: hypothetical protein WKF66_17650 [Pedobacter sp.]